MINTIKSTFVFFILCMNLCLNGQNKIDTASVLCNELKSSQKVEGEKHFNRKYFDFFSIMLRDTCISMNRFTNCYIYTKLDCSHEFYYRALLVNSENVETIEPFIKEWFKTNFIKSKKRFVHTRKKMLSKYIRIYGGFLDELGNRFVVVQFVTQREFNKNPLYKQQFDLFATRPNSELRFMILKIMDNEILVHSYFL